MYKPVKSLTYHGDHESKMHPEERKQNPLKSSTNENSNRNSDNGR